MADRRFDINDAITMLRAEADHRVSDLKSEAVRLEEYLLEAYAAALPQTSDPNAADVVHIFEFNTSRGDIPTGAALEVMAYGYQLGRSLVAPTIKAGRYRAVLMLTRLPDEPSR